jgi:glyoxylase-like metal-dependent hydrolase (beta-lactamase superfamily II)
MVFCHPVAFSSGASEFCLDGEFDICARYQGTRPLGGEFYPTTRCVTTEDDTRRVLFSGSGRSNPDLDDDWTVAYLPPDLVRIVNRESPPDIEFRGTDNLDEALRVRRIDPRRLLDEYRASASGIDGLDVTIADGRIKSIRTTAALPLRGQVDVVWHWTWTKPESPELHLVMDGTVLFRASGRWRQVTPPDAAALWTATSGAEPVEVPGDRWPAHINMQLIKLADGVFLVRGVRTGFQHLVVDTGHGLVVGDAPAGWVEFHHLPPSDLVPGLGISGLSEKLVDFLEQEFPGKSVLAVALTHFHDDHAGGARAFAAAGARIYADRESAQFYELALNRRDIPNDRLSAAAKPVSVTAVSNALTIGGETNRVRLLPIGKGPHAHAMLGIWAVDRDVLFVSDIHVPNSDADIPRDDRAVTECWFAEWAVANLPAHVRVVNSHSAPVTPVSRLGRYLQSDLCQS